MPVVGSRGNKGEVTDTCRISSPRAGAKERLGRLDKAEVEFGPVSAREETTLSASHFLKSLCCVCLEAVPSLNTSAPTSTPGDAAKRCPLPCVP